MKFQELQNSQIYFPEVSNRTAVEASIKRLDDKLAGENSDVKSFFDKFLKQEKGKKLLCSIFGNSPYLTNLILKNLDFFAKLMQSSFAEQYQAVSSQLNNECANLQKKEKLMEVLRVAKQKIALLIAIADITKTWELEEVTGRLSEFAELTIRIAVEFLLKEECKKYEIVFEQNGESLQENSGFIVLALGKLGAGELNYSSDIDLVVFYDLTKTAYLKQRNAASFFINIARQLVNVLQERTKDGYVFRTDLRLRPDPFSTPVAVSVDAALKYYESVGQNWERAAMIKAKHVAGDNNSASYLLGELKSFVWRKYLDFEAIQDIHSIKRQISSKKEDLPLNLLGYNIKIGLGGIRTVEFFAQTQQLIWGGRVEGLRSNNTCEALKNLADNKKIPDEVAEQMIEIYRYLRELEHRMQMVNDAQTHSIPQSEEKADELAIFMGYKNHKELFADLYKKLVIVQEHYSNLYGEAPKLSYQGSLVFTGIENDPETLKTLEKLGFRNTNAIADIIRQWHHGRHRSTGSKKARELITELTPLILKEFGETSAPDKAFFRFDEFLSKLPSGVQMFSLFAADHHLVNLIAEIMGGFPYLSENLSRKPALLEYVLFPEFYAPVKSEEIEKLDINKIFSYGLYYEEFLNEVRRWVHDRQFRAGVQLIKQKIEPGQARKYLTALADAIFPSLLARVEEEFFLKRGKVKNGKFVVLALGKLGSRELTFDSDIDLIFIHDSPDNIDQSEGGEPLGVSEYYARLSKRFISSFSAMTQEGRLYEVDIRLRPSGNDGPISTSIEAFGKYYNSSAWIFEFMALTRARVVAGDDDLGVKVLEEVKRQITKKRDAVSLAKQINENRIKVENKYKTDDIWNVKYVRGGLIDLEFIVQYLQLLHANENPQVLDSNTIKAIENLAKFSYLSKEMAEELEEIAKFYLDMQTMMRLAYSRETKWSNLSIGLKEFFIDNLHEKDFHSLEAKLTEKQMIVRSFYDRIIG